jgi:cell division protein FtsZ
MSIIHDSADPDANIIFGAVLEERLKDEMKITVIATGFDKVGVAAEPIRTLPGPSPNDRPHGSHVTNEPRGSGGPEMRQEDVNIPAFMRKKAD